MIESDSKTMDFRLKRTGFKGPRGQVVKGLNALHLDP
jgi:hypothetical protein